MNNIFDIYESILDNDDDVKITAKKRLVNRENLTAVFKQCIPSIRVDWVGIQEDGNLTLDGYNYDQLHQGVVIDQDLPDYVNFVRFPSDEVDLIVNNFDVTTLRGLPADLSNADIKLLGCSNFKDFGTVKSCRTIIIKNTADRPMNLKEIKHFPKAKFIRLFGFDDLDVKTVSKLTGFPKNKITIL